MLKGILDSGLLLPSLPLTLWPFAPVTWSLWVTPQKPCLWHSAVYESRNLNYVCLQTHGHKRVLMLSLPDGQTSTILNSSAFLRAFLSCISTKPIAKKPYEVVQSCNMSTLFLSGPRCTTTAADDFWELEATIYDVGQISLSRQWKEAKKWILCAFVWVAVPIGGP